MRHGDVLYAASDEYRRLETTLCPRFCGWALSIKPLFAFHPDQVLLSSSQHHSYIEHFSLSLLSLYRFSSKYVAGLHIFIFTPGCIFLNDLFPTHIHYKPQSCSSGTFSFSLPRPPPWLCLVTTQASKPTTMEMPSLRTTTTITATITMPMLPMLPTTIKMPTPTPTLPLATTPITSGTTQARRRMQTTTTTTTMPPTTPPIATKPYATKVNGNGGMSEAEKLPHLIQCQGAMSLRRPDSINRGKDIHNCSVLVSYIQCVQY
ncbi:hypothetical protein F4678DRAFT_431484, partial [Xylaria arbuscula]